MNNTKPTRRRCTLTPLSFFRQRLHPAAVVRKILKRSGDCMARRISATELVWLITEALKEGQDPSRPFSLALAVVSDDKMGWRTVIERRSRRSVDRKLSQKLAYVEAILRREYALES